MKVKDFLKLSKANKAGPVLKENIGDAILYKSNPIFKNIRDVCLSMGYQYSTKNALEYASGKFFLLDQVKKTKIIPYLPNNKVLKNLEKNFPSRYLLNDIEFLKDSFNPVFHESCHVICYETLKLFQPSTRFKNKKTFLVHTNFEEAFTDTAEHLSNIYNLTEAQKFSAKFNAYIGEISKDDLTFLKTIVKQAGFESVAKVMMLVGLCVHFMNEKLDLKTIKKIRILSQWPLKEEVKFANYVQWIFSLMLIRMNPFRASVADFYFSLHGYKNGIKALNFNPIDFIENNKLIYKNILNRLAHILEFGLNYPALGMNWESLYRNVDASTMPWFSNELDFDLKEAITRLKLKRGHFLDIGTGVGTQAHELNKLGFKTTATDISKAAIKKAKFRFKNIDFIVDDITDTKLNQKFDFVLDRACLHGLKKDLSQKYIKSLKKVLKPGGYVFIKQFSKKEKLRKGNRFSKADIKNIFTPDFVVKSVTETHFKGPMSDTPRAIFVVLRKIT